MLETIKTKLSLCIPKLQKSQLQHIKYRCTYILNNIDAPWADPTLSSIIHGSDDIDTDVKIEPEQLQRGMCRSRVVKDVLMLMERAQNAFFFLFFRN